MPITSLFANPFMENKKHPMGNTDESAVVKAAAWAWYTHGSGSEGKPMREFDIMRTQREPTPSRYKLEAFKLMDKQVSEEFSQTPGGHVQNGHNSLLDPYEKESISRQLDCLTESSNNNSYKSRFGEKKKKKKSKKFGGFWLRKAAVCGTREDDVIERETIVDNRLPGKQCWLLG